MDLQNPRSLAAELRVRARCASPGESADLRFLAAEYERLATALKQEVVKILLPK